MVKILKQLHPIVQILFMGAFFTRLAASMSVPFLAIYLSNSTDIHPVMIGVIIGAAPLASTVTGFVGGLLSDKIGRKHVMLVSIYIWGVVYIGIGIFKDPYILLTLNILNGICRAFFEPVSQAFMGDLTKQEWRAKVFSIRYTAANIGFAIGPMIGAFAGLTSNGKSFIITGFIYLIYSICLHYLLTKLSTLQLEEKKPSSLTIKETVSVISRDKVLLFFILGGGISQVAYAQLTPLSHYLSLNLEQGALLFSWLMTTNAIVVVMTQIPLSSFTERFHPIKNIYAGNVFFALGGIGFAFSGSTIEFILSMIVFTLGEVLCVPSGAILIDRIAPHNLRGTYYGANNFKEMGKFVGPALGMILLTSYGVQTLYGVVVLILLLSNLSFWLGYKKGFHKQVQPTYQNV